jgi:hypothetical protein
MTRSSADKGLNPENAVEPRISRMITDYQSNENSWVFTSQVNEFISDFSPELFLYLTAIAWRMADPWRSE